MVGNDIRLANPPMPEDVVDLVAKEVAAQVKEHIEAMYPDAARAVAWNSASRSIQGVVRNTMKAAGDAAEQGRFEEWLERTRHNRLRVRKLRRDNTDD